MHLLWNQSGQVHPCMFKGPNIRGMTTKVLHIIGEHRTSFKEHKKIMVDEHNRLRAIVARGEETRGVGNQPQPSASNMMEVVWDDELALTAQA